MLETMRVRNTLKYVPDKDRKAFATDLKTIYQAADEKKALATFEATKKWTSRIGNIPSQNRQTGRTACS